MGNAGKLGAFPCWCYGLWVGYFFEGWFMNTQSRLDWRKLPPPPHPLQGTARHRKLPSPANALALALPNPALAQLIAPRGISTPYHPAPH